MLIVVTFTKLFSDVLCCKLTWKKDFVDIKVPSRYWPGSLSIESLLLYHALVLSTYKYGCQSSGSSSPLLFSKLDTLQLTYLRTRGGCIPHYLKRSLTGRFWWDLIDLSRKHRSGPNSIRLLTLQDEHHTTIFSFTGYTMNNNTISRPNTVEQPGSICHAIKVNMNTAW